MNAFSTMPLQALVCQEGHPCNCGLHHRCALDYLNISRGAIAETPEMIRTLGKRKPFVVCDPNTYEAAGRRVVTLLSAAGIDHVLYMLPSDRPAPAEWEVGSILMHFDPGCDMFLAVGSGVINDLCKVCAHASGRICAVVGTAPSMDGYASNSASMEVNHVKVSLYCHAPAGILLDTDILAQAPMRMLWAGLGDIAAKYIAVCEWRISHLVIDEYYCEAIADMMRTALHKTMSAAPNLPDRDPEAVQAIAEGLVLAGIAMAYAQISRPASGLEHYFSHMWEMMALERGNAYDLHGIQVGVGTVLTMGLLNLLKTTPVSREKAEAHMDAFDSAVWEQEVRRIFGKTTEEILAIEAATHKNDPDKHALRLDRILDRWDTILRIMDEELPDFTWLRDILAAAGMPMSPGEIGISLQDTVDAFLGSRDVRDKYLTSSLLWDLGLTKDFAAWLAENAGTAAAQND